jgi:hypothetical protein
MFRKTCTLDIRNSTKKYRRDYNTGDAKMIRNKGLLKDN